MIPAIAGVRGFSGLSRCLIGHFFTYAADRSRFGFPVALDSNMHRTSVDLWIFMMSPASHGVRRLASVHTHAMDEFWAPIINASLAVIGIAASIWLGLLGQTGARRRIENIKAASEVLARGRHDGTIQAFIDREAWLLKRQLDPKVRAKRVSWIAFVVFVLASTAFGLFSALLGWGWADADLFWIVPLSVIIVGVALVFVTRGLERRYERQLEAERD